MHYMLSIQKNFKRHVKDISHTIYIMNIIII